MTGSPSPPAADGDLEAFAAQAAHQLGEAVALIRASSSILQDGPRVGAPERDGAVTALDAGVDRAQRFVDDLLDVVSVTRAELELRDVPLDEALGDAREALADPLRRSGMAVEAGDLGWARLDRRLAHRLLVHALRPPLAAGARWVGVERVGNGRGPAHPLTLRVTDDGAPPADDALPRLFDPFRRARGSGPFVGAGVSLAVCRRIVERHGGTIAGDVRADGRFEMTIMVPSG